MSDRQKITVEVVNIYVSYMGLDDLIEQINLAKQDAEECGYIDITATINDPYDDTHYLCIKAKRWETDTELAQRVRNEEQQRQYRHQQFLRLKQEFEPDE